MPAKKDAQWWADYRARKKAEEPEPTPDQRPPRGRVDKDTGEVLAKDEIAPGVPADWFGDRAVGLPRSNYEDAQAMGEAIAKAPSWFIAKVLDHPAIKTSGRDKK